MTLKIRPVQLNRTIYVRPPYHFADIMAIRKDAEFLLELETSEIESSTVCSAQHSAIVEMLGKRT